jgi:hypothetical protein
LRLSSIPTVWTKRWVCVLASHGSISSAPSRNLPKWRHVYKATQINPRSAAYPRGYWVNALSVALPLYLPTRS